MKLEVGKKYRLRNGEVGTVLHIADDSEQRGLPFVVLHENPITGRQFTLNHIKNGVYTQYADTISEYDIVSEILEPVISETPQETDIKPIGSLWTFKFDNNYYEVIFYYEGVYFLKNFNKLDNKPCFFHSFTFRTTITQSTLEDAIPYTIPEPEPEPEKSYDVYFNIYPDKLTNFYNDKEKALKRIDNEKEAWGVAKPIPDYKIYTHNPTAEFDLCIAQAKAVLEAGYKL